jgi:hypothetical protein
MSTIERDQYDLFYADLKRFLIKSGWVAKDKIIGANDDQLLSFERWNRIKLEEGVKIYLKHFGNTSGIPFLFMYYCLDLLNKSDYIENEFITDMEFEEDDPNYNIQQQIINSLDSSKYSYSISQPIFTKYIDDASALVFINLKSKELIIGSYLSDTGEIYLENLRDKIRRQIFRTLTKSPLKTGSFVKIPWLEYNIG